MDCIFCGIIKGEIPSTVLYKDEDFIIIKDINPQAKVHLLAVPVVHVPEIDMMTEEGTLLLGKIMGKISHMQEELGLTNGYRLVINQGEDAGQTVNHVHIHILGGEKLKDMQNFTKTLDNSVEFMYNCIEFNIKVVKKLTTVRCGENESVESALKRFKRKCQKDGIIGDLKKNTEYLKPSVRKKEKQKAARKRAAKKSRY